MEDNKEKETEGTPTVEEQLEALKKEKEGLETQLEEKTRGLKTAHQTLTQKDDELKRRGETEDRIASIEDQMKFFIAYQSEQIGRSEDDFTQAKTKRAPDLMKKFEQIKKESEEKRQSQSRQREVMDKLAGFQGRVEAIGLTEDDDEYLEIKTVAVQGTPDAFKLAEKKLARLEAKHKEKTETPKETPEEMKTRLEREILEKHGLLTPEAGTPSASSSKKADVIKKYAEGDPSVTREEYEKAMKA